MKKSLALWVILLFIIAVFSSADSYWTYFDKFKNIPLLSFYEQNLSIEVFEATEYPLLPEEYFLLDKTPVLLPASGATWNVNIPQSGLYTIYMEYAFLTEAGEDGISILIDGLLPFDEAISILPPRYYRNNLEDRNKPIRSSALAPLPAIVWQNRYAGDTSGKSDYPFKFYFTKGKHQVTLKPVGGKWFINQLKIATYQSPPTLVEYRKLNPVEFTAGIDTHISLDGATYKYQYGEADAMVYMDIEADPIRDYNALGRWRYPGNGVIWEFEVDETGFYRVAFRYALGNIPLFETPLGRLTYKGFLHSERLLLIDGKIPYQEAEIIIFQPTDNGKRTNTNYWYLYSPQLGKNNNEVLYLDIFLTKGKHTLELVPSLKKRLPVLDSLEKILADIIQIEDDYRQALGIDPNPNLWYQLSNYTPERTKNLLTEILLAKKKVVTYSRGSQVEAALNDLLTRLTNLALLSQINTGHMVEITRIRETLQWVMHYSQNMPLNIDSIELYSPNNTKIKANYRNESFWSKLKNYWHYRVNI